MPSPDKNRVILSAAGSRKTEYLIEAALAHNDGPVLILTYTNENQRHIISRLESTVGVLPPHIIVSGWFSFLIAQCAKPYQRVFTEVPFLIKGLNFEGRRNRFARKETRAYFFDRNDDLYRDGVSEFVVQLNTLSQGAIIKRLGRIYRHIFIDEVQDLVGYDLDLLELLFDSPITMTLVGDPRQHTLSTNIGPRNKRYRGAGLVDWFEERGDKCTLETRDTCYRCNQMICDFADAIYPTLPRTVSAGVPHSGHDGVFQVDWNDVPRYIAEHGPVAILRHDKNADTLGYRAMNIGLAKGRTFDRVLVFPTKPMLTYLQDKDPTKLKAPERLYVAVTRARFSVAFAVRSKPAPKGHRAPRA
jgi:DNA helicase II / ATP-dependent DNA helicase PcrA